jgi:hypothetical protein
MGGGPREKLSHDRTLEFLKQFGCPNPQLVDDSKEWEDTKGDYPLTPDLVAGPLKGNGDPGDFYIEVHRPTNEQYTNPHTDYPQPYGLVQAMREQAKQHGGGLLEFGQLGASEAYLNKVDEKLKYGTSRGSPLVGIVSYFGVDDDVAKGEDSALGSLIGHVHALQTLILVLAVEKYRPVEDVRRVRHACEQPGAVIASFGFPFPDSRMPLTFILWMADKGPGNDKRVLIINERVIHEGSPWLWSPVARWLHRFTTPNGLAALMREQGLAYR